MSATSESPKSSLDTVKWLVVFVLLSLIVLGNYLFEFSTLERAVVLVVLIAAAGLVAAQTLKGKTFIGFARDARTEVRKVVWPTRQETTQTTIIVMVATLVVGLLLWGLDAILLRVVSFFTGLGV